MATRYLPLHESDTAYWALLTCPSHRAGDVEVNQHGAFTQARCRECAKEAETQAEKPLF
jgi:hypothetical protein